MSLRLKFALLFSAMLLTALLAFGFGMHVAIERMTRQMAERELAERARALIASNDAQQSDFRFKPAPVVNDEEAGTLTSVQLFRTDCSLTRIFNRMRQMMVSGNVLPLSEDGLLAIQDGQAWLEEAEWSDETHLVYSLPIVDEERLIGVAQVAQPFGEQERMLTTVRDGLLFGGGAVAVLAFGLVWGMAGYALRPIARMAREAQAIAAQRNFTRQLQPVKADGDLSRLAVALNTMLAELHTAYRQAETTLESQRDLMADVSHELRAPLTTVRGNLGLLQRDMPMDAAERKAVLRDAVDEVERMSRLVNEMLLLTRAGHTQPMRLAPVDVVPLAANMRRKALALAQRRSIVFDQRAERLIVNGNPDALDQVLLILLDNAVKFTPDGGQITLSVEADSSRAYISVHDTGVGIAPEALPRVFDRFYQADGAGADAQSGNGHGLGLAIARSLVEAQGGAISVRSTRGRGSVFTVSLPLI
jgi:signal transduction histidine kinase